MPRSKSVLKRQRQNERRRLRNKATRTALKSGEKKVRTAAPEESASELKRLQADLDRAAASGRIHPNKAARKKSRLAKLVNRASG